MSSRMIAILTERSSWKSTYFVEGVIGRIIGKSCGKVKQAIKKARDVTRHPLAARHLWKCPCSIPKPG